MSSKKLVTQATAFITPSGLLFEDYNDAAQQAASDAIEEACYDADGDVVDCLTEVHSNSWRIAEFILNNRPLIRKILGL